MKNIKQKIYIALICILAIIGSLCGIFIPDHEINNTIGELQNIVKNEIIVTEEVQTIANETIEATVKEQDLSTTEIIESSEEEEKTITDESALEDDALVEQENISYNGTNTGNGLSLLGAYQGLTYYSQADSRWANIMYSSVNNHSQTMKSSACGPTSAAMIVSSSKGTILPTTMAKLSVDNGYRTVANGTAWSFYPFIADYFDFNEYYTTSNFNTAMNYLSQKNADGSQKYYAIVSCGSGLWTTGGHYIVIAGVDGNTVKVYDPYLYNGKFNTASRRAANVKVSGNSALVSKLNFQQYSNAKNYFIYSNDKGKGTETSAYSVGQRILVDDKVAIAYDCGADKVLVDNGINQYWIHRSIVTKDSKVYGLGLVCWSEGSRYLVQIFDTQFWISGNNLTSNIPSSEPVKSTNIETKPIITGYKTGKYKISTNLNVRSGPGTNYKAKTSSQLTANARQQNARLGGKFNGYRKGVICTVTKVSGDWGYTSSGWINLKYAIKQ